MKLAIIFAALALLAGPVYAKDDADCSGPILQLTSERCLSQIRGPRMANRHRPVTMRDATIYCEQNPFAREGSSVEKCAKRILASEP